MKNTVWHQTIIATGHLLYSLGSCQRNLGQTLTSVLVGSNWAYQKARDAFNVLESNEAYKSISPLVNNLNIASMYLNLYYKCGMDDGLYDGVYVDWHCSLIDENSLDQNILTLAEYNNYRTTGDWSNKFNLSTVSRIVNSKKSIISNLLDEIKNSVGNNFSNIPNPNKSNKTTYSNNIRATSSLVSPQPDPWAGYDHDVGLDYVRVNDKDDNYDDNIEVILSNAPNLYFRVKLKRKGEYWKDVCVDFYISSDTEYDSSDGKIGRECRRLVGESEKKKSVYLKSVNINNFINKAGNWYVFVVVNYSGGKNPSTEGDKEERAKIVVIDPRPNLEVYDFWRQTPIYANPFSSASNYNFWSEFKIRNTGNASITIERLAIGVHDVFGKHLFDISKEGTGIPKYDNNISLSPGQAHSFSRGTAYINIEKDYRLRVNTYFDNNWHNMREISFTALPQVTNTPPIHSTQGSISNSPEIIKTFQSTSAKSQHSVASVKVPTGYKVVSCGAKANPTGANNLLFAVYPLDEKTCIAKAKDHLHVSSTTVTAYATALHDQNNEWNIEIHSTTSSTGSLTPQATVSVPNTCVLTGGGASVNWKGAGSLLTAIYPVNSSSCLAKAKAHGVDDYATITTYAVCIHPAISGNFPEQKIFSGTGVIAQHPSHYTNIGSGYVLTGGGALDNWNSPGNLLTASYPTSDTRWSSIGKDHLWASPASLTTYAIGLKLPMSLQNSGSASNVSTTIDNGVFPKVSATTQQNVSNSRIINLSVSDVVNPNLNMGFIASGSGSVKVLLRAWNLEFVGTPSVDPILTVKRNGSVIATNDSWLHPYGLCQPIPADMQQAEFVDSRNAACYLDITPGKGYVIELTSKYGSVANAQLSADVDARGNSALTNASTSFYIDSSNRGTVGMGFIVAGNGKLQVLSRIWNLGFAGVDPNTDPSLLLRKHHNLATIATNDNFHNIYGNCQPVTNTILVNPEFYNEPRNAACLTSLDAAQAIHLIGDTPINGRIQMSLDLLN